MTNTKLESTAIVTIIALLAMVMVTTISQTNATHLYTGIRWPTTSAPYCTDKSLGHLNIGLSKASNAATTASSYINGFPSKWFVPRINNDGGCHNRLYAASFGLDKLGITDFSYSGGRFITANIGINQNYKYTSSGCTNGHEPVRLSYVFKHEFTHWVQMKHATVKGDATYPSYICTSWSHWGSHSQDTVKAVYG